MASRINPPSRARRYVNSRKSDTGAIVLLVVGVIAFILALLALGSLFTMLLWNLALVPLVAVCGGSIGKIGFWLALGVNLILFTLRGTPPSRGKSS